MTEFSEKTNKKEDIEKKENIIVTIFKKLLGINFLTYGGNKDILK